MKLLHCARFASSLLLVVLVGCTNPFKSRLTEQVGESVVLVGEEPAALAFVPRATKPLFVRSTYLHQTNTVDYVPGQDYVVNLTNGTLWRTPASRLPDFRTNNLFGQAEFDHSKFPGFGNTHFFAYVDYSYDAKEAWPVQKAQAHLLPLTRARLHSGQPVKLVAFGDSITAGGDATRPELIFWQRWAESLRRKYPRAAITAVKGATGGDSTVQGLQRLESKVLDEHPDLVLVAFGMNDHNKGGVPPDAFVRNLEEIVARIRAAGKAEVVLLSTFPPNPNWKFGSHRMEEYAAATEQAAKATHCAYVDIYRNWQLIAARKKPEDLLGNNINHPNDFGHWLYFRVLCELGL